MVDAGTLQMLAMSASAQERFGPATNVRYFELAIVVVVILVVVLVAEVVWNTGYYLLVGKVES